MPKRVSIFVAGLSLVLAFAACGGGGGGVVVPTPSPYGTLTPNPKDRSAQIEVTIVQSPVPHIPVEISTPRSSANPRPGKAFATQNTGKLGKTIFRHLNPTKTYCWKALLGGGQTSSTCASWDIWQTSIIGLGT